MNIISNVITLPLHSIMNIEELRNYCIRKPLATEDFPFDEHTLAFKVEGKLFALTNLQKVEHTVNLKCDPAYALELRETYPSEILPGYHMNKKHWNTINYNSLPNQLIMQLIDHSFALVIKNLPKKVQLAIHEAKGK